jgi:hypothetical protein
VGAGGAGRELLVVTPVELGQRAQVGRREHQLALEAELVERGDPVVRVERAQGVEVLVQQHVARGLLGTLRRVVGGVEVLDRTRQVAAAAAGVERGEPVAHGRVGVGLVEAVGLEQVGVGVVDEPRAGVRRCGIASGRSGDGHRVPCPVRPTTPVG